MDKPKAQKALGFLFSEDVRGNSQVLPSEGYLEVIMGQLIDIKELLLERILKEYEAEMDLIRMGIEPEFEPYETKIYQLWIEL